MTAQFNTHEFNTAPKTAARIADHLRRHGWFAFDSELLGETLVVFDTGADRADLPVELRGAVMYTADELRLMVGLDDWSVRALHEFKRRGGRLRAIERHGLTEPDDLEKEARKVEMAAKTDGG